MRIDNVKDTKVQEANDMLDAKIKTNLKSGLNLHIQHKPILPYADLKLINVYSKKKIQLHSNTEFGIFQARNSFLEALSSIHSSTKTILSYGKMKTGWSFSSQHMTLRKSRTMKEFRMKKECTYLMILKHVQLEI